MKVVLVETIKGLFYIPRAKVAEHRALEYKIKRDSEMWENEVKYLMDDDYELMDWLLNNTDWGEWFNDSAVQLDNYPYNVTKDEFWKSDSHIHLKEMKEELHIFEGCERVMRYAISDDFKKAFNYIKSNYPEMIIETINDKDVVGFCEVSGLPIYEDSQYWSDQEGCTFLESEYPLKEATKYAEEENKKK